MRRILVRHLSPPQWRAAGARAIVRGPAPAGEGLPLPAELEVQAEAPHVVAVFMIDRNAVVSRDAGDRRVEAFDADIQVLGLCREVVGEGVLKAAAGHQTRLD